MRAAHPVKASCRAVDLGPAPGSCYGTAATLAPDVLARLWRGLPTDRQEPIGTAVLRQILADLIADDDGLVTTSGERDAACGPAQEGCQQIFEATQAAIPQVLWYYPDGRTYEARDAHGNLLGTVEDVGVSDFRFRPVSPRLRLGRPVKGQPVDSLPRRVRKALDAGGTLRAIMPDGHVYPDDFRPLA